MRIISRIKHEAKKQGKSMPELCRQANVSYQTVWRSLVHNKNLTAPTIEKLIKELNLEIIFIDKDELKLITKNK